MDNINNDLISSVFQFTSDEYVFHATVCKEWLQSYKNTKSCRKTSVNQCDSVSKIYEYVMSTDQNRCFSITYFSFIIDFAGLIIDDSNIVKYSSLQWIMQPYCKIPDKNHILPIAQGFAKHNSHYRDRFIRHVLSMHYSYVSNSSVCELVDIYMSDKKSICHEERLLLLLSHRGNPYVFNTCVLKHGGYSGINMTNVVRSSSWMEGSDDVIRLCIINGVVLTKEHFDIGIKMNSLYLVRKCLNVLPHSRTLTPESMSVAMQNGSYTVLKYLCDNSRPKISIGCCLKKQTMIRYPRCFDIYQDYLMSYKN